MSKLNQTVLVIGGAGYIGSHIVLELCEQGYDVTVFDNLSTGYEKNIDSRADFIQGDILNDNDLSNIFKKKYSAVFHFAALKAAGESMLEPGKYATANITGTINILNQMADFLVKIAGLNNIEVIHSDIGELRLPEKSVDGILSIEAISHYRNYKSFLKMASKVLRNNGFLVIRDGNNGASPRIRKMTYKIWDIYDWPHQSST